MPDINDTSLPLDDDIRLFRLTDLTSDDSDALVHEAVVARAIEASSSATQCHVINFPNSATKRKRCSQSCKKGTNMCHAHYKVHLAENKKLVFVE